MTTEQYTEFLLDRTGLPQAKITARLHGHYESPNAAITDEKLRSARQWFIADVYVTKAGTWVARIQYRAGSRLTKESPVDCVYTAKSERELTDKLDALDPVDEFVTGWPDSTSEYDRANHKRVCGYACEQFDLLMNQMVEKLSSPESIE